MGFFRRDRDKDGNHPDRRPAAESFLSGFNAGALACVFLPLLILLINSFREGGGGGRMGGWFREDGSAARGFVYLWSLATSLALVGFVNDEISSRSDDDNGGGNCGSWLGNWNSPDHDGAMDARQVKTVVVALAMFANLCFLCLLLIVGVGEGGAEELGRAIGEGQFLGTMFLTFAFWLLWGLGSSFALYRIAEGGVGRGGRDGDDVSMGYVGMRSGRTRSGRSVT